MKNLLLACTVLLFGTCLIPASSFAQDKSMEKKNPIELKAAPVQKKGANPNIKGEAPTKDVAKAKPAEARGSGPGACSICLDNHTGYYVKVYVDGYYRGTLDAYGNGCVTVGSGYTTLYCITTGGTLEWNFKPGECNGTMWFDLVN